MAPKSADAKAAARAKAKAKAEARANAKAAALPPQPPVQDDANLGKLAAVNSKILVQINAAIEKVMSHALFTDILDVPPLGITDADGTSSASQEHWKLKCTTGDARARACASGVRAVVACRRQGELSARLLLLPPLLPPLLHACLRARACSRARLHVRPRARGGLWDFSPRCVHACVLRMQGGLSARLLLPPVLPRCCMHSCHCVRTRAPMRGSAGCMPVCACECLLVCAHAMRARRAFSSPAAAAATAATSAAGACLRACSCAEMPRILTVFAIQPLYAHAHARSAMLSSARALVLHVHCVSLNHLWRTPTTS